MSLRRHSPLLCAILGGILFTALAALIASFFPHSEHSDLLGFVVGAVFGLAGWFGGMIFGERWEER